MFYRTSACNTYKGAKVQSLLHPSVFKSVHLNSEGEVLHLDDLLLPGTFAGACQPSRWAVTLMDVHYLGKGKIVCCY